MIPGDDILQLNFSTIETRTDLDGTGAGTFSENDRIGLYINNGTTVEYRELTLISGEWQPRLRRSEFGQGALTISAHYPIQPELIEAAGTNEFTIAEDQTSEGYTQTDLLFSQRTLPEGELRADFSFTHALHRLRIQFTGENDASVKIRSRLTGSVNLLTREISTEDSFGWITPRKNTDGSFEAVIFPQPTDAFQGDEGLLKIETTSGESTYRAPESLNEEPFVEFRAGAQLTIRLDFKQSSPDLANQSIWVYGLNVPDFPGEDKLPTYGLYDKVEPGIWFRKDRTFEEIQNLTWKEGCGWYDCNKSPEYNEDDANTCWAASASNLILWWLNQNKAYIDAYTADWGNSVTSVNGKYEYELPSSDFLPLLAPDGSVNRNAVFNFFKVYCQNIGSWNSSGVRWFITGDNTNIPTEFAGDDFPGFFTHVFSKSDVIAIDSSRSPSEEDFNKFIVNALLNKQAIGFTVYDIAGKNTGNHALVIWGAEFDAEGKVSHIYYCENNYADQDVNGAVISRMQIGYEMDPASSSTREYTFLKTLPPRDGSPAKKYRITSLCAVDLRQDIWAEKYPSVTL